MKTFISILLLYLSSFPAFAADCTSPHGVESQTRFDAGILYYCNGTNWIRMDTPPGAGGLGCIVGNIAIPPGGSGTFYSATSHADCASISEVRTCTNGVLSGNAANQHISCVYAPPPCGGVEVGGNCWYLSVGQSCDSVCSSAGLTCNAAETMAIGSGGSNTACNTILNALSVPGSSTTAYPGVQPIGCAVVSGTGVRYRYNGSTTTCAGSLISMSRACACNN